MLILRVELRMLRYLYWVVVCTSLITASSHAHGIRYEHHRHRASGAGSIKSYNGISHQDYDQPYHYAATPEMIVEAVEVPYPVQVGHSAKLRCVWRVGSRGYWSTRWYKNEKQFYKFIKGSKGSSNNKVEGVNVSIPSSDDHVVTLQHVGPETAGTYKCEIMSEGPQFKLSTATANLTVVELPEVPEFLGLRERYMVGDTLNVTCRAQKGRPAPRLDMKVNDDIIHEKSGRIRQLPATSVYNSPGLFTSQSRLVLPLSATHIPNIKLVCVATTHGLQVQKEIVIPVDHRSSFFSLFGSTGGGERSGVASSKSIAFLSAILVVTLHTFW